MNITREAAIERLVDMMVEVCEQEHGWVREVLHSGRIGYDNMCNEALSVELEVHWPEDRLEVVGD